MKTAKIHLILIALSLAGFSLQIDAQVQNEDVYEFPDLKQ
jgi:hypothetical protein